MDINDLKLGQIAPLLALFNQGTAPPSPITQAFIGQDVIIRSYSAGNHFGVLEAYEPAHGVVILKNARRLWRWKTTQGVSLSEVATSGINPSGSKICTTVDRQIVAEVDEILPCSITASASIKNAAVYQP